MDGTQKFETCEVFAQKTYKVLKTEKKLSCFETSVF